MIRRPLLFVAVWLAGMSSLPAVPLNFRIATMEDPGPEGPGVTRPFITEGARAISFRLPQHARVNSDAEHIVVFMSEGGISGEFSVRNSTLAPAAEFVTAYDEYQKAAADTLPKEAEKVEEKPSTYDLYAVNNWKSVAFEWDYVFFAHATHRQVAYITLDPEHQICLTIIADANSWKTVYGTAQRFMKSWYWLEKLPPAEAAPKVPKAP